MSLGRLIKQLREEMTWYESRVRELHDHEKKTSISKNYESLPPALP